MHMHSTVHGEIILNAIVHVCTVSSYTALQCMCSHSCNIVVIELHTAKTEVHHIESMLPLVCYPEMSCGAYILVQNTHLCFCCAAFGNKQQMLGIRIIYALINKYTKSISVTYQHYSL